MKRLFPATDRSSAANGRNANARIAAALAGDRFMSSRTIGHGVQTQVGVPERGRV